MARDADWRVAATLWTPHGGDWAEGDRGIDDPFLVAMAERATAVQQAFEERQSSTEKALADLFLEIENNTWRKQEQNEKGLDGLSYFVMGLG